MELNLFLNRLKEKCPETLAFFLENLKPFQLEAYAFLYYTGDITKRVYFIEQGFAREFYVDEEGFEHTVKFYDKNHWIFQYGGMFEEQPSTRNLQVLEPTHGYYLNQQTLQELLVRVPTVIYPELLRAMAVQKRITEAKLELRRLKKVTDRLAKFEAEQPEIAKKLSVGMTASYLNISREELSRVRSKRAGGGGRNKT